ncbi:peroxiredoxin-2C-like [Nilaparvata lugens]|uniref:peroxiredoxin-2C-like n=1 Tax=Nilaparvata lugens TaxID=108931 RepID=UPI00193E8F7C|nr:peroxiredoxin-2C-like [Nilaparvata lugens]
MSGFRRLKSVFNGLETIRKQLAGRSYAKACDMIPYVNLFENTPDNCVNIHDFCFQRKVIIFGVPGAFTPTCSARHLPGFISKADDFKKMGVDEICCVSVNDPFVMSAWGKHFNAQGKVRMLADTRGELTEALGVCIDLPNLGGMRSMRYSMVVQNGIIQSMNVESDGVGLTVSDASQLKV